MTSAAVNIDHIEGLEISSQTVYFMPRLEKSLALRLQGLDIKNSHLKSIEKEDLRQFPNIKVLYIVGNDLEWLDGDLFEFTPKLKLLNFNWNKISMVGAGILEPLKYLQHFWMIQNECTNNSGNTEEGLLAIVVELEKSCVLIPEKIAEKKQKLLK